VKIAEEPSRRSGRLGAGSASALRISTPASSRSSQRRGGVDPHYDGAEHHEHGSADQKFGR
jgi:hypothetical protein